MPDRVLLIEPDPAERSRQLAALAEAGFDAEAAAAAESAFRAIEILVPDVILCDAFLPGTDDLELVWQLARRAPEAILLITASVEDLEAATEIALRGAEDCLEKPIDLATLRLKLRNASERARLRRQNRLLRWEIAQAIGERPIVAASSAMIRLLKGVERVSSERSSVLLMGALGTGKEVIARVIHSLSSRRNHSFVVVECEKRSAKEISTELFGDTTHGPVSEERTYRGLLLDADRGTLFLDEIAALPLSVQDQILQVISEQQVLPKSAAKSRPVDLRIIAATTHDLEEAVAKGRFREPLYHQFEASRLAVPALRDRREDIPLLVDHFIDYYQRQLAKPVRAIAEDALAVLVAHYWVGNIRELENVIEMAVMLTSGDRITLQDLPSHIVSAPSPGEDPRIDLSLKRARRTFEMELIRRALRATNGNRTHAAKRLEISHRALLYKIKEYGISD